MLTSVKRPYQQHCPGTLHGELRFLGLAAGYGVQTALRETLLEGGNPTSGPHPRRFCLSVLGLQQDQCLQKSR